MINKIILVSIDTLRFDCVGYQPNKDELRKYDVLKFLETPNLDEIAKKSICFTNAISVSTYTTSAHASILTGLYPPRHGIRAFYDTKLSENVLTLAEILKKEGYVTILSTDIIELFEPLGLTRGFSHIFTRRDKELYDLLEKNKDNKVFLFVHFFDVHEPYLLSDYEIYPGYNSDYYDMINFLYDKYNISMNSSGDRPYELWNHMRNNVEKNMETFLPFYIEGVSKFDKGRFREFMHHLNINGYVDDSLLMIFSDHGEGRCNEEDINMFSHGGFPYDNVIRIPLMVYYDGIEPNTVNMQVSIVDIFPTILEKILNTTLEGTFSYNIDGKNLFSKNGHDYVRGEVWGSDFNFYETDQGLRIPDTNLEWFPRYRFIRFENKKFIIIGMLDSFIDESIFNFRNYEFIRWLYRSVLGRVEDTHGFEYWLKNLDTNIFSKKDVINYFLQSIEYQNKKKFVIVDLENDRDELSFIDPLKDSICDVELSKYIDNILNFEKLTIRQEKIFDDHEKIFYTKEYEKKIKEKLKTLGYFN